MKGFTPSIRKCYELLISLAISLVWIAPVLALDNNIVIIKSSNNSYFNQTIETLINHLDIAVNLKVISVDKLESQQDHLADSELIITLGYDAAAEVTNRYSDKRVIQTYITLEQQQLLNQQAKNHISVLLNQPLRRYIAFTRAILNINSIGIMKPTPIKLSSPEQLQLDTLGIKLNQFQPVKADKILATLRQLLTKSQVLLMLPEKSIYNRDTLKGILLTTYRNRTPVISYSPSHVKSGALASIYSSPEDIGRHVADLLNTKQDDLQASKQKLHFARYYSTSVNHRVAYSLGLNIPPQEVLLHSIELLLK